MVRFGRQVDVQGVLAGTPEADKLIGYVTKYITKSVAECHTAETAARPKPTSGGCGRSCASRRARPGARTGCATASSPRRPGPSMRAGHCKAKVHQLDTLGIGGRRVLVSRHWSGKTLADHRYDQAAWVRKILAVGLGHTTTGDDEDQAQRPGRRRPRPAAHPPRSPGNAPDPTTPTCPTSTADSCAPSPPASNTAPHSPPPERPTHPAMFRQPIRHARWRRSASTFRLAEVAELAGRAEARCTRRCAWASCASAKAWWSA